MLEMRLDAYCIAFIRSSIILTGGVSCELSVFIFDLCCPWIYSIKYSSLLFRIQNYPIKQETADLNLDYKQFKLNCSERSFLANFIAVGSRSISLEYICFTAYFLKFKCIETQYKGIKACTFSTRLIVIWFFPKQNLSILSTYSGETNIYGILWIRMWAKMHFW